MHYRIETIIFDDGFEKKFQKYTAKLSAVEKDKIKERLSWFKENAFDPRLKTHKLKGILRNYWAFSISFYDRIIFRFIDGETAFFVDIDDHTVYKKR